MELAGWVKRAGCQGNAFVAGLEPQSEVAGVKAGPALGAELVREAGPRGCAFPVFPSRWRYRIADALPKRVCLRQRPERGGAEAGPGRAWTGG